MALHEIRKRVRDPSRFQRASLKRGPRFSPREPSLNKRSRTRASLIKRWIRSIDERRFGSGKSLIFTNGRWNRPWLNWSDKHSARGRLFEREATETSEVGSMDDSTMRGRAGGKHRFTCGRKRRRVKRVEPRKRVARRENARCIGSARETSTPSIAVRSVGASIGSVGGNRWSHVSRIELFTRNREAQSV